MQRWLGFLFALAATASMSACGEVPAAELGPVGPSSPVPIERAELSADHRSIRLEFTGGKEFVLDDPCSVGYLGTAHPNGDELDVAVYPSSHPTEGTACTLEGHPRTLTLQLDQPFNGSRVRDRAGRVILLRPPQDVVEVTGLPDGWRLRSQGDESGSSTPTWRQTYSPVPNPGPDDSRVELYQRVDAPRDADALGSESTVSINGTPATLSVFAPAGELEFRWQLGSSDLLLVGNLRDFTRDEFIALAESVKPTPR